MPTVTLSPNARNLVFEMTGVRVTATPNAHEAERWSASVAVHDTELEPTVKVDPDGGEQATVTGA
jgi:hypothetical protein